jgi:hypothetical protein
MRKSRLSPILATFLALTAPPIHAQTLPLALPVPLDGITEYSGNVPLPEDVFGHRIGDRHTRSDQVVEYFRVVADASPRVTLRTYASSHLGRPLIVATVTSPENHARLEDIRAANMRLSDAPEEVSDEEIERMPTIIYLGYGVHGNEASTSEAAVLMLYHLAAGNGPAIEEILGNTVILIDPDLNPDGRGRFVEWVNSNRGRVPTSDSQDREHNQAWPNGRSNHYLFDLNRDWVPAVNPESVGRLRLFHSWRPQLHTDYHEMGGEATYFFQPGVASRDNPNTPPSVARLTGAVAEFHARELDRIGALYFSREAYDDFFYGKGSTYPDVNGAIGILFEQGTPFALHGETQFGLLTYAYTIRSQFLTSLSTIRAGVEMRTTLLRHQRDFYSGARAFARASEVKGYLLGTAEDQSWTEDLVGLLLEHRIRVFRLGRAVTRDGVRFEPGQAYVVPVEQRQARLVQGLLERRTSFADSIFYDVSAWTLPLAYGIQYAEIRDDPSGLLGQELLEAPASRGEFVGGHVPYAYVLEWGSLHAPRALQRLLESGIRPLLVTRAFAIGPEGSRTQFSPGDVIIPVHARDQRPSVPHPDQVQELVDLIIREDRVRVHGLVTGLTPEGFDLGSRSWPVIQPPRVAILAGRAPNGYGEGSHQVGEVWHLLNHRTGIPASLVDLQVLSHGDLSRYDVIAMTNRFDAMTPERAERLRQWVEDGGLLILSHNATAWGAGQDWIGMELRSAASIPADVPWADVSERSGAQAVGGAITQGVVDVSHPVAFGVRRGLPLLKGNRHVLAPPSRPGELVASFADEPLLAGHLSPENRDLVSGGAAVVAKRVGNGRVIAFTDNPVFRGFWKGTERLFVNAVFFGRYF